MSKEAFIYYTLVVGIPLLAFLVIIFISRSEPTKRGAS